MEKSARKMLNEYKEMLGNEFQVIPPPGMELTELLQKQIRELREQFKISNSDITTLMINFAKMHVERALQAAAKQAVTKKPEKRTESMGYQNVSINDYQFFTPDKDSILNAYPLENIK